MVRGEGCDYPEVISFTNSLAQWQTLFSNGTKVPSSVVEALGTYLHQVLLDSPSTPEGLPYIWYKDYFPPLPSLQVCGGLFSYKH